MNPPVTIGAVRIDQNTQGPYRAVFGIHSLQHGDYGMFIEYVSLVVDATPLSSQPLNVWYKHSSLDYSSKLFYIMYNGESADFVLDAIYVYVPGAHVQLTPGEANEIDVEVSSSVTMDVHFHIEVTYRISNQAIQDTLRLPGNFELVFSGASNWHQYTLYDGYLRP